LIYDEQENAIDSCPSTSGLAERCGAGQWRERRLECRDARGRAARLGRCDCADHGGVIETGYPGLEVATYQLRGGGYLRRYRYDEAIADANSMIAMRANWHVAYRLRGQARSGKRQYAEAIADLTYAIDGMTASGVRFCWLYDRVVAYQARAAHDIAAAQVIDADRAKNLYCLGVAKLKVGDATGEADVIAAAARNPDIYDEMRRLSAEGGF
jgi:hypothetical protein